MGVLHREPVMFFKTSRALYEEHHPSRRVVLTKCPSSRHKKSRFSPFTNTTRASNSFTGNAPRISRLLRFRTLRKARREAELESGESLARKPENFAVDPL